MDDDPDVRVDRREVLSRAAISERHQRSTPDAVVAILRRAQEKVVHSEPYRKTFDGTDGNPEFIDGPDWGRRIQKAYDDAARITKDLGLVID